MGQTLACATSGCSLHWRKLEEDGNFALIEDSWQQRKSSLTVCRSFNFVKLSRINQQYKDKPRYFQFS